MSNLFCSSCRSAIAADMQTCMNCGAQIVQQPSATRYQQANHHQHPSQTSYQQHPPPTPYQQPPPPIYQQPVYGGGTHVTYVVQERKTNGLGTAGFVLALLGLIFCWIPVLSWILWLLGLLFSFIGVFKSPRGLAIAGLVLTFISTIILIVLIGAFGLFLMF